MTPLSRVKMTVAVVLLASASSTLAQDTQQATSPEAVTSPPPRVAVPRSEAPRRADEPRRVEGPARQPEPRRVEPRTAAAAPVASAPMATAADDQRRAEPRGSRPRGDNPPTGVAVPRPGRRPAPPIYRSAPRVYNNYYYRPYYYYPRRVYPYGYGAFGLGYFYYNPYSWYGSGYYAGPSYGVSGYSGPRYGYPAGQLRLRVTGPKDAHVLVDGYYAGVLDDFDGIMQALTLEEGPYDIEIVAPGYEPLQFDVRITPGHKITYRGDMRRLP